MSPDAPKLVTKVPLYAPDSRTQSVVRSSTVIKCSDPRFDDLICTTREAYTKAQQELVQLSYQCKDWGN